MYTSIPASGPVLLCERLESLPAGPAKSSPGLGAVLRPGRLLISSLKSSTAVATSSCATGATGESFNALGALDAGVVLGGTDPIAPRTFSLVSFADWT